jgi:hypothetical protein
MEDFSKINAWFESIVLTDQEIKDALLEGKKCKYFREKSKEYWEEQEKLRTGKVKQL